MRTNSLQPQKVYSCLVNAFKQRFCVYGHQDIINTAYVLLLVLLFNYYCYRGNTIVNQKRMNFIFQYLVKAVLFPVGLLSDHVLKTTNLITAAGYQKFI